jgi:hypothetical protein
VITASELNHLADNYTLNDPEWSAKAYDALRAAANTIDDLELQVDDSRYDDWWKD